MFGGSVSTGGSKTSSVGAGVGRVVGVGFAVVVCSVVDSVGVIVVWTVVGDSVVASVDDVAVVVDGSLFSGGVVPEVERPAPHEVSRNITSRELSNSGPVPILNLANFFFNLITSR